MITNNCCNQGCVDWEWKLFWMTWLFWAGNTVVEQLWSNECSRKTMSLASQVVPVLVPLSWWHCPIWGKSLSRPYSQDTRGSPVGSIPGPGVSSSSLHLQLSWDMARSFQQPRHVPSLWCRGVLQDTLCPLQDFTAKTSAHCDNEGSFFYQVWVWSAAIPSAN